MTDQSMKPFWVKRVSLRLRYSLIISGLIAIIMTLVSVLLIYRLEDTLRNQIKHRGMSLSRSLNLRSATFLDFLKTSGLDPENLKKSSQTKAEVSDLYLIGRIDFDPFSELRKDADVIEAFICNREGIILRTMKPIRDVIEGKKRKLKIQKVGTSERSGLLRFQESLYGGKLTYLIQHPILAPDGTKMGMTHLFFSREPVAQAKRVLIWNVMGISLIAIALGILGATFLASIVTRPIHALVKDVEIVGAGNLEHMVAVYKHDEIGELAWSFNEMTKNLKKAQDELIEKERMEADIDIARRIQQRLLPKEIPSLSGFDIAASYRAAREVGGDYYDFIQIDDDHLGIVIADVSGKGVPGCIVMAMARSILRSCAEGKLSPAEALQHTNSIIYNDMESHVFVTVYYAVLNLKGKTMRTCSAGHNPLIHFRAKDKSCELVNPDGIALGFDEGELFSHVIKERELELAPDDLILLYTDGVTEARNPAGEEFGENRLIELMKSNAGTTAQDFLSQLDQSLRNFCKGDSQDDDITLISMKIKPGDGIV